MTEEKKQEEKQLIETVDENGSIISFELFDIIEYESKEYALLIPAENKNEDDVEVVLMKLIKDGEDYLFEAIEDDDEFNKVSQYIETFTTEDEE